MTTDPSTTTSKCTGKDNYTGTWKLSTSENLDNYLKSEGWGWARRKVAQAANATQLIEHDVNTLHAIYCLFLTFVHLVIHSFIPFMHNFIKKGNKISIKVTNPMGTFKYELEVGSNEVVTYVDNTGDTVETLSSWTNDSKILREEFSKTNAKNVKKNYVTERFMKDGFMCLKIANTKNLKCFVVRFFKKSK